MFEVKERPQRVEHAYLVGVQKQEESVEEAEYLLDELADLVRNLEIGVDARSIVRLKEPRPRYLLGSGKAEEIVQDAKFHGCDCIVFDVPLSPAQQRNWESLSGMCVIDRQEVILDIFADRAQTKEAVLQVELARMEYSLPRLKNAWSHLSRQRGGGVTQRGEGEAQIELDQRMVRDRIARLKKELDEVIQHRDVQRKRRLRVPLPTAALVGYTNAGKSSLLNRLTGAEVLEADKLFATLDPTTRQFSVNGGNKVLLTDTVGFVRRLPHRLVEAFKATLEESVVANFLLHVLDASNPDVEAHSETTLNVLEELGAEKKQIITLLNKADRLDEEERQRLKNRHPEAILVSAHTGEGVDQVRERIERMLAEDLHPRELLIPHNRYDIINRLHESGCVKREKATNEGVRVVANLTPKLLGQVEAFVVNNGHRHSE